MEADHTLIQTETNANGKAKRSDPAKLRGLFPLAFRSRYLHVLGEAFVELLVVLLVLCQFSKELQALLDDVLADDLQDLALLQHLSGNVEGQVLGVHHTTDEV